MVQEHFEKGKFQVENEMTMQIDKMHSTGYFKTPALLYTLILVTLGIWQLSSTFKTFSPSWCLSNHRYIRSTNALLRPVIVTCLRATSDILLSNIATYKSRSDSVIALSNRQVSY